LSQKVELYRRFFPETDSLEAAEFAEIHSAETMAQFQGLLLALEQGEPETRSISEARIPEPKVNRSVEEPVLETVS
jgi:hypothetical protein